MSSSEFDWYKLSLLNDQKPDLQKFQQIIRNANIMRGIERVPTSYRKKLLTIFQTLSSKMKYETKSIKGINQSLGFKKNAVADRLEQMQKGLEESKQQLIRMKSAVAQKKKMTKKLNEKIQTLKKNKTQQTYFCPFCSRNDFASRQIFTFHMYSEHQTYKSDQQNSLKLSMPNNSLATSAHNQLKDFIMTLKDKQMEMMKMILGQKKELQTQELERLYEKQMNLMTMKNRSEPQYLSKNKYSNTQQLSNDAYGQDIDLGADGQEIHGESQFLFYQKSQKYKQAAQKEEYSLRKALQARKNQLNRHPYYDVFKDMEENKSLDVDAHKLLEESSRRQYFVPQNQEDEVYTQNEKTNYKILSKFNLKSNGEIMSEQKPPVQPLKMTSNNLKFQQFNPSITDRLKQEQKKNSHNNTIYSGFGKNTASKGFSTQHEYVFNSGPLVDDNGGYSDYEDYFGDETQKKSKQKESQLKRPQQNESINFSMSKQIHNTFTMQNQPHTEESIIEDEEIKLNPGSYSFVSRSSFSKQHISQLLSPNKEVSSNSYLQDSKNAKDKYNMYHNIHEKSSQIVDLSDDSFSRRDFQLSKDESSINLSDLKLSKLEKKRAQDKEKQKFNPKSSSPTYGNTTNQKDSQTQGNFVKKPLQFMLVSEQKPFNISRNNDNEQKINLLNEFEKKIDTPKPLLPQGYSFQKKETYELNQFYKHPPHAGLKNQYSYDSSSRSSKLNEFIKSQHSKNQNTSPNVQESQQERALSPHEYFAKQLKKNSSYGSFNQNQLSNNNPQSYVSKSSTSQAPKIDFSEYQKPSLSKEKRQSSRNSQINQSSQESSQRSSARDRKRFQRHEDLEGPGNDGLLNEFFKKQFQGESMQSGSSSNYRESSNSRNQDSYQSSRTGSIGKQGSRENSRQYSKIISQEQESSALDQFIK